MKQNQQSANNNNQPPQASVTLGNYVLGKSLGKGTFGKVKLATHMLTGEKVAIKILEKDRIKDKKDVERITREIKILKKVRHPNVIQLYEIIETESELYLIMEFCPNGELFDFIVSHQRLQEKLACKMYQELIQGIDYIHQSGVCHRDLKPENLLLDFDKTLKLVDFGLSNMYEDNETLKTACGSPCYAAPEMIAGKRYQGLQTDIWSSGVVLFAMVCGYLPFEDPKTSNLYKKILSADYQIPKFVSQDCADILKRILNTNPEERFTLDQIRNHPWFKLVKEQKKPGLFPTKDKMPINDAIYKIMLDDHTFDNDYAIKCIEANRHNQITATYHLIHKRELRHNRQVPDHPMRMVTSSIDRQSQNSHQADKQVRASRVYQPQDISSKNSKRGDSVVGNGQQVPMTLGGPGHQDLNQTLPTHFYPHQALQSVHGGEEKLNLNDSTEVSAQKKYKLQLQAEINKLKSKYQNMKKEELVAPNLQNEGNSQRVENGSVNQQVKMNPISISNQGDNSPSPDHYAFVQNLQEQMSSTSKHTHNSNLSNNTQNQNQLNIKNGTKQPSAATTDSTIGTSSYNDYQKQSLNSSHHQRFRTQVPTMQNMMNESVLKSKVSMNRPKVSALNGPVIAQPLKQAWKGQHPQSTINSVAIDNPQSTFNKTQILFNGNSTQNANPLQKFTTETPIKQNRVLANQLPNFATIEPSQVNSTVHKKTPSQLNSTLRIPEKSPQSNQTRKGRTQTLDASPDQTTIAMARKTVTQQMNASTLSTQNQETDYSYPINSNQNVNRQRNQPNKFTDLRLQTAIDFQAVRAVNNSSQNKSNIYSNAIDYMMKQQTTIKNSNHKGTVRYSNHANRNQSGSPRHNSQLPSSTINESFNNQTSSVTPNLNISELYKQYSKKPPHNLGVSSTKQNGRALSVIEPPYNVSASVNHSTIPQNNSFSGRQGSQTKNQRKNTIGNTYCSFLDTSMQGQIGVNGGSVQLSSVIASKTLYNRNFHS